MASRSPRTWQSKVYTIYGPSAVREAARREQSEMEDARRDVRDQTKDQVRS